MEEPLLLPVMTFTENEREREDPDAPLGLPHMVYAQAERPKELTREDRAAVEALRDFLNQPPRETPLGLPGSK